MTRSIPAYAQPRWLDYVSGRAAEGDEAAVRLVDSLPKKGTRKTLAPGASKDQRRAAHREATKSLREQVAERSAGRCEVSGVELGAAWEMHHLRGGGERRSRQSLDNVLAVSWETHRRIHRGDLDALRDVKEACIRIGLRDGLAAIEKRISKAETVRRTPSVPINLVVR
jgi:hypothetical protein